MSIPEQPSNIRDVGVSIIRTVVPGAWGAALAWLATQVPAFEPVLNAPGMAGIGAALALALIGAWHALFRSIENKLPAWLTVLVLGSNKQPSYSASVPGTVNWVRDGRGPAAGIDL
jgi:hypothetical protein